MRSKTHRVPVPNEQIDSAIDRPGPFEAHDPRDFKVRYDANEDLVSLDFADGVRVSVPRKQLQGLENATRSQLSKIEIVGHGTGLHWPLLGVDHYVLGLLDHKVGTNRFVNQTGRLGGLVRNKAKPKASGLNGLKGGRPKPDAVRNK